MLAYHRSHSPYELKISGDIAKPKGVFCFTDIKKAQHKYVAFTELDGTLVNDFGDYLHFLEIDDNKIHHCPRIRTTNPKHLNEYYAEFLKQNKTELEKFDAIEIYCDLYGSVIIVINPSIITRIKVMRRVNNKWVDYLGGKVNLNASLKSPVRIRKIKNFDCKEVSMKNIKLPVRARINFAKVVDKRTGKSKNILIMNDKGEFLHRAGDKDFIWKSKIDKDHCIQFTTYKHFKWNSDHRNSYFGDFFEDYPGNIKLVTLDEYWD